MSVFCGSLRVNEMLEGGLRLSQLSALSLLEMSSSESLGVENGELLSTSSYLLLRPRDEPASMETRCLRAQRRTHRTTCNTQSGFLVGLHKTFSLIRSMVDNVSQRRG